MSRFQTDQEENDEDLRPSRTQKKREREAITKFTERLAKLPLKHIKKMELPAEIEEELIKATSMKADSGKNRQVKLVAGLIFTSDQRLSILSRPLT